jgi:DNA-binding SARP family transcriptional activator/tetratricopeptide (TPR) repeat protein
MDLQSLPETENLIQLALKRELTGDVSGALRLARQALNAARINNQRLDCAQALTAVARYRFRLGQYDTARELAQEAMEMTDPNQDAQAAVHTESLLLLGMCALETNSLAECEQYYRSAANLAREIGHSLLFQRAMHNLGSGVYLFRGQFDLAIAADSQSLQICRDKGYLDWAVFPLITLAIAYQITGQRLRTCETLTELRALVQPGSAGEAYVCYVSGMLALDEEDFQNADNELSHAYTLAEELGDPSLNLDTRLGISRMWRLRGEISKALVWAEDALHFAQRVGYRIYQGRAQMEYGRAAWLNGDWMGVENNLLQAEAIFIDMDLRCDLTDVRLLMTAFFHQKKDLRAEALLPWVCAAVQTGGYGFLLERERSLVYSLADYLDDPTAHLADAASELLAAIRIVPPNPLKVVTLGKLEVWVGAKMVEARVLRQRRSGELLALLLSSPGYSLSAEQVTEAMCPEKDPLAAVDFYHHAISALRRMLEPDLPDRRFPSRYLDVGEERIALILPSNSKVDFQEFERSVLTNDWENAIEIYGGEYLPMYCYSEWTIALRQHLADQFERALLVRAAERLKAGDAAGCLDLARRALLHNAWQERAVELGMRAALALSDRSGALKMYKRLEKVLMQELGIAPQKELQTLYAEAKRRTP